MMSLILYKNLSYFFWAASSLLLSGFLLNPHLIWSDILFLLWTTITGIFLVYRVNDFIDQTQGFYFNLKSFLKVPLHLLFSVQFLLIITPIAFFSLSYYRFVLLTVMLLMGIMYSLNFKWSFLQFRIKNIFLVKNIFIGLCWGGLVLIGSNLPDDFWSFVYFLFASIQVFMGSIIRDISDIEQDRHDQVYSMPVVLGPNLTLKILFLLNLIQMLVFIFMLEKSKWIVPLLGVSCWRFVIIAFNYYSPQNKFWTQKMNLFTCNLLFLGILFIWGL